VVDPRSAGGPPMASGHRRPQESYSTARRRPKKERRMRGQSRSQWLCRTRQIGARLLPPRNGAHSTQIESTHPTGSTSTACDAGQHGAPATQQRAAITP
jgi:hypothetical protein